MISKYGAKLVTMGLAALAVIAFAAPIAQAKTPAAGYTQFAGCKTLAEDANSELCVHSVVTGGHFQMGNKDVPITTPIHLTGGVNENLEKFSYNSEGGLRPAKQKVPGGVIGLTGLTWLAEFLGIEALTLYAQTELAGTPKLGILNLQLPIKVHLINGTLGNNCYVGSNTAPIVLNLTTGTTSPPPPNKPITGIEPTFSYNEASEIISLTGGKFVDNSFAAPGANGCVLTLFGFIPISINGLVNLQSGLPSPAGTNETTQNINSELAPNKRVYP